MNLLKVMATEAEASSRKPEQVNPIHIRHALAAFDTVKSDQQRTGQPEDARAIVESLKVDNKYVADYVQAMVSRTNDLEAQRLIATTAWVVFEATALALDPEGIVEKPES